MSSILKDTPASVTELRSELPRDVAKLIRRCLAKNPEDRLQAAKDLRNELRELKQEVDSGEVFERATPHSRSMKSTFGIAAAIVATAAVTYLLMRGGQDSRESQPAPIQGSLTQLTSQPGPEWFPSLSPDGINLAYSSRETGNADIYLKRVGGERIINLTEDSSAEDLQPAYSPDGELIAFRSARDGGGIFLMGATGESVKRLTDFGYNPAWSPNGKEIAYATEVTFSGPGRIGSQSKIWAVNVASGESRLITEGDGVQPTWSPGGSRIAYWASIGGQRDIWTIPANGGESVPVTNDVHIDWNPVWSPDGKSLYFSSDRGGSMDLWRVPIDEETGMSLGEPEAVTTGATASHQHLSVSMDGRRIAYVELVRSENIWKVGFDTTTGTDKGEPVPITQGSRRLRVFSVSPDGRWLAGFSLGAQEDLFIMKTDGTGHRQLTDDIHKDRGPRWSPDGQEISFYSNRSGSWEIWTLRPDGSGLKQLTETPEHGNGYPAWSPDGTRMAGNKVSERTSYIFDPGKPWNEQTPQVLPPLGDTGDKFEVFSWSPDGHSLAGNVVTPEDGWYKGIAIYSIESRQYRTLTDFGMFPVWTSDSRRIIFGSLRDTHIVDIESGDVRKTRFGRSILYATSPDNQFIYFSRQTDEADIWMLTLNEEQK
jgi:Tol biopolymer transport system component